MCYITGTCDRICVISAALTFSAQMVQNLCFTKKIRYESRKQLAQARPRIKGQFVRMPSSSEAEVAEAAAASVAAEDVAAPSGAEVVEISEDGPAITASPFGIDAAVGADIKADAEEVSPAANLAPLYQIVQYIANRLVVRPLSALGLLQSLE